MYKHHTSTHCMGLKTYNIYNICTHTHRCMNTECMYRHVHVDTNLYTHSTHTNTQTVYKNSTYSSEKC